MQFQLVPRAIPEGTSTWRSKISLAVLKVSKPSAFGQLTLTLIVCSMFIRIADMNGKSRQIQESKRGFMPGPKARVFSAYLR